MALTGQRALCPVVCMNRSGEQAALRGQHLRFQAQGRSKKAAAEVEDPYQEFRNEHLDALEARNMLHNVNAEVNLAADLFDHVSLASF